MKRLTVVILGLVFSASWAIGGEKSGKDDLKRLQGKWKTITITNDGEAQKSTNRGEVWVVSGDKVIYPDLGVEDEIKVDGSKNPKVMDIRMVRKGEDPVEYKAIFA